MSDDGDTGRSFMLPAEHGLRREHSLAGVTMNEHLSGKARCPEIRRLPLDFYKQICVNSIACSAFYWGPRAGPAAIGPLGVATALVAAQPRADDSEGA
jgi:hypothetical protein